jgi:hypothetical protein
MMKRENRMYHFMVLPYLFVLFLVASTANALEPSEMMIEYNRKSLGWLHVNTGPIANEMRVVVEDQVENGCWTSAKASKTAVELELKRSGHTVSNTQSNHFDHRVVLSAQGYALDRNQICVIALQTSVVTNVTETIGIHGGHELANIRLVPIWTRRKLLTGPKYSMNSRTREEFVTSAQEFLNDVENVKADLIEQVNQTYNVHFKEPRDVLPSKRRVSGENREELRSLWRRYFDSYLVKNH